MNEPAKSWSFFFLRESSRELRHLRPHRHPSFWAPMGRLPLQPGVFQAFGQGAPFPSLSCEGLSWCKSPQVEASAGAQVRQQGTRGGRCRAGWSPFRCSHSCHGCRATELHEGPQPRKSSSTLILRGDPPVPRPLLPSGMISRNCNSRKIINFHPSGLLLGKFAN